MQGRWAHAVDVVYLIRPRNIADTYLGKAAYCEDLLRVELHATSFAILGLACQCGHLPNGIRLFELEGESSTKTKHVVRQFAALHLLHVCIRILFTKYCWQTFPSDGDNGETRLARRTSAETDKKPSVIVACARSPKGEGTMVSRGQAVLLRLPPTSVGSHLCASGLFEQSLPRLKEPQLYQR